MNINKTDIINAGLYAVGAKKIFAPSDNTKAARLAESIYQFCRELVYNMPIDWKFSIARSGSLAQVSTDPVSGFDHQYGLPDNTVRVLSMIEPDSGDEIEFGFKEGVFLETTGDNVSITRVIETSVDEGDVFIRYIVFIENEEMYPAWFSQLIALRIAIYIAEPLKQHTPHYNKVKDMMANALVEATEANARWNVKTNVSDNRPTDEGVTTLVDAASLGAIDLARCNAALGIRNS